MIPIDAFEKRLCAECFVLECAGIQIQLLNKCSIFSSSMHLMLTHLSIEHISRANQITPISPRIFLCLHLNFKFLLEGSVQHFVALLFFS